MKPDTVQFYELHTYSIINIRMDTRCKALAYKLLHFAKLSSIYNMEDKIFSIPSIQTVKTWPRSWPLTGNISLTRSDAVACLAIVSDTRQITCHIYPVSGSLLYSARIRPERWTVESDHTTNSTKRRKFCSVLHQAIKTGGAARRIRTSSFTLQSLLSRKPLLKRLSACRTLQWCGDPCHDENRTTRADCSDYYFSVIYRTSDWQGSTWFSLVSNKSSAHLLNCCFIPISRTLQPLRT
jgi:hypothetical protein